MDVTVGLLGFDPFTKTAPMLTRRTRGTKKMKKKGLFRPGRHHKRGDTFERKLVKPSLKTGFFFPFSSEDFLKPVLIENLSDGTSLK